MTHHGAGTGRAVRVAGAALVAVLLMWTSGRAAAPIRVMLLDGESGGTYHDWQRTTPALKKMLDETALFDVTVVTAPAPDAAAGRDAASPGFAPDFSTYQVVVLNYDAPDGRWTADVKASFERFVGSGGGVVAVHAADNAFSGWPAYN